MQKFKNILITGAKGQLGFEFQRLFNKEGIPFIATDVDELDITSKNDIEKFFIDNHFDCIINCAAYNDVDGAEDNANICYLLNAIAPELLANVAKKINAVFVTYSTDFVFDGNKNTPYKEDDVPNPLSVYAKSKLEGENRVINAYNKSFVIRTSWLFGIAGKNFNTQVLGWAEKNSELNIVDDQVSSPTYAKDLAEFSWLLLQTGKFGLYHFSNNGQASKYDQAQYLLKKAGWDGVLKPAKSSDFVLKAARPAYSKLNSRKIEAIVGKKIPTWQSGIERWYDEWQRK